MAKEPPDLPSVGDRVRRRGFSLTTTGTVLEIGGRRWTTVEWDKGVDAPRICHTHELVKIV